MFLIYPLKQKGTRKPKWINSQKMSQSFLFSKKEVTKVGNVWINENGGKWTTL